MNRAPRKSVKPDGMAGDWKQERLEADFLLRSLYEAHCEDERHRKWLLRRWPEWCREGPKDSLLEPDRFIPECYLREVEDDVSESLQSIRSLVNEAFGLLEGEDDEDGQVDVPGMVAKLSDIGVVESIPLLLPKLRRKALQSILSTLSERKREARNRPWLIEKVYKDWMAFGGESEDRASTRKLQKILAVVRDPNSFRPDTLPWQLSLDASCPWTAARSALTLAQLEQLPIPCLHVMLEVLLGRPPGVMIGKLPAGSNKERIVTAILEQSEAFLCYEQGGETLPEPLRRTLVVMSVSARYAFGVDGNLIDYLGPLHLETQLLQGNLLAALSYLKKLNYKNLLRVHKVLIGAPKLYKKKHPGNLMHPIRRVLLDCLLRSEVRSVPEEVKTAAVTIRTLAMEQLIGDPQPESDSGCKEPFVDEARIESEVESTLRISSHLLQIMYNWKEVLSERSSTEESQRIFPGSGVANALLGSGISDMPVPTLRISSGKGIKSRPGVIQVGEEDLAGYITDGGGIDMRTPVKSDSGDEIAQVAQAKGTNTRASDRSYDCESVDIDRQAAEENENFLLTAIADEAAEVGYALVGCAMERTARSSGVALKRPVRRYLRSGTIKKIRTGREEGMNVEQHQLSMILKIAGKIPSISPRVMDNVKRRLGMG